VHKSVTLIITTVFCLGLWGCGSSLFKGELLVVNFEQNQPLRYRMISQRETRIDLAGGGSAQKSQPQTMTEQLELVMVYTPVEVDPFGLTTLKVTCESAKVTRTSFSGRQAGLDAVESLPEMSFTLELTPTGQINDMTEFKQVVRQLGDKAFADVRQSAGRVKNPDMISDFIAMQWYVWDSIASVDDQTSGLSAGKTWKTRQLLPWPSPVPNPPTRITTFKLDKIVDEDQQRKAHITSTYELTEDYLKDIPLAYEGSFQMRGLFGFLRRYQFESMQGGGSQIFNIDTGVLEKDDQHYTMQVSADFMLLLGDSKPMLQVNQTVSIELLK
jgi:hypothetical protein